MNSKERHFSFETNFERTTDKFRKNVIRSNDLARKIDWKGQLMQNKLQTNIIEKFLIHKIIIFSDKNWF